MSQSCQVSCHHHPMLTLLTSLRSSGCGKSLVLGSLFTDGRLGRAGGTESPPAGGAAPAIDGPPLEGPAFVGSLLNSQH